jgi:DNA-binding LacI/PurR family transcriptional regulator
LAQQRTDTIGVIVSDLHNPFYTEVLDGIDQVATELGYRVLIAAGGRDRVNEKSAADTFIELRAEGVVAITPRLRNQELADIAALIPTVVVGRPGPRPPRCSSVHTDDGLGIELAVQHLWELGHRRIAHVSAGAGPGARARESGYREAMGRRDLGAFVAVARAEPNEAGGRDGALELLDSPKTPTAIIASNDFAALGVLSALGESGLRNPDDVSVVGYDNSILAHLEPVSLTSVNQPRTEMGRTAAQMLRQLIEREPPRTVALEPTLAVRTSTASAPDANARRVSSIS